MRILESGGSRFIPAFNGAGERMHEFDLSVPLGAHFDPRRNHPGPRQITVPAPSRLPAVGDDIDPAAVRLSQWVFTFGPRDIDGQSTLTMTMRAEGDATKFEDMENNDYWGQFFFDLAGTYARLCK